MIYSPVEIFAYTHTHTYIYNFIYSFLTVLGLPCSWAFSSCRVGASLNLRFAGFSPCWLLLCGARTRENVGFSPRSAADGLSSCCSQAPEHKLNSCCSLSLVAPWHVGSPQLRMPYVSCPDRWYHWTTREDPMGILIQVELSYYHGL